MANTVISKQARRAARAAASAAQDDLVRRTRANVEDLGRFFSARERADAVDGWLEARQQVLRADAERRRGAQRVVCGRALAALRDRGESLREIARMADVSEKQARELIREAEAAESAALQAQDEAPRPAVAAADVATHVVADPAAGADGAAGGANEAPPVAAGAAIENGAGVKRLAPSSATA